MRPLRERRYYVYVPTNRTRRLYVGVTNDLERRMYEHKDKLVPGFASKYNLTWLAYYEETSDVMSAIEGEKEIKGWRRSKKMELVESMNPEWKETCRWSGARVLDGGLRFPSALLRAGSGCARNDSGRVCT